MHTPGPWHWETDGQSIDRFCLKGPPDADDFVLYPKLDVVYDTVNRDDHAMGSIHATISATQANADLLAAAPDLLAACEWLLWLLAEEQADDTVRWLRGEYKDWGDPVVIVQKAKAAIAEAKGE